MFPLTDARWAAFTGGYKLPYDASVPLRKLLSEGSGAGVWDELWQELHHQGDVGQASYAPVPWLVEFIRTSTKLDWNPIALVATIELERERHDNPVIADELAEAYFAAIRALPEVLTKHSDQTWDESVLRAAVTCIALARGQRWFAQACFELDRDTAARWFSAEFGWDFPKT